MKLRTFDQLIERRRACAHDLPDPRSGANTRYEMTDFALAAFAVFFAQSPSFLAHQRTLRQVRGTDHAATLFQIQRIPSDNHIRNLLDTVAPERFFAVFDDLHRAFDEHGLLRQMRAVQDTRLIALDATRYYSSQSENIRCQNCSSSEHANGRCTHFHSAITPVIVSPGHAQVVNLRPEFITPQDGHAKQDCEIAAAKRWLAAWVADLEPARGLRVLKQRVKGPGNQWEQHEYRWANDVPLTAEEGPLRVNWCAVTVTDAAGRTRFHNAYITDHAITADNVAGLVAAGRARWKIENENNNVLKNQGYHLEHNFGHGKEQLSSTLVTLNLLAFLGHTFLELCD